MGASVHLGMDVSDALVWKGVVVRTCHEKVVTGPGDCPAVRNKHLSAFREHVRSRPYVHHISEMWLDIIFIPYSRNNKGGEDILSLWLLTHSRWIRL